jgi:hypothetical protein
MLRSTICDAFSDKPGSTAGSKALQVSMSLKKHWLFSKARINEMLLRKSISWCMGHTWEGDWEMEDAAC